MKIHSKEILKFIINLIFAIYNCVLGIASYSWWFISVGAYYIVLSIMRIAVIIFFANDRKNERFIMRFTGIMIFVLSIVLCGIVYMTTEQFGAVKYHEIAMITIALYAFTKLTLAIYGFIKSRKNYRPYIKTLRSITFTDSVVSIYSLQRSMLVSFEGMTEANIVLFNTLSGIGMCLIVISIGLNLIQERKIKMAKSKLVKANEKIAEGVIGGYKKIEKGVVDGYKKIENGVVDGYTKIEDKFVDRYLTRDGETVEEAKERLKNSKN